jgi:Tol biopolymer transport system component
VRTLLLLSVALCGCGIKLADQPVEVDAAPDAVKPPVDAGIDSMMPLGNFGVPAKIPALASATSPEDDLTLNNTETELIFAINLGAGAGLKNLYVSTRANTGAAWGAPVAITALNTADNEHGPRLSADGLTLYFGTLRGGTSEDVWMSRRTNATSPWQAPTVVAYASSAAADRWFTPCGGKYLVASDRTTAGDLDIYEGVIGQAAVRMPLSGTGTDTAPFLTTDCLTMYWAKDIGGGNVDIVYATRTTIDAAWQMRGSVPIVSTAGREEDPWLSADGRRLYLASSVDTELDLYVATR